MNQTNKLLETIRVGQKPATWISFASNPKSKKILEAVPKILVKKVNASGLKKNILKISKDPKKFEVKKSKEMMISQLRQVFYDLHDILDESAETNYQGIFENITKLADLCRSKDEQRELPLYIEEIFPNTTGGMAQLGELVKLLNDNFVNFKDDNESKEPYPRALIYDLNAICKILPKYNKFFEPIQKNFDELKQKYFNYLFSTSAMSCISRKNIEQIESNLKMCQDLQPKNPEPYKLLAAFYYDQKDYDSVIEECSRAINIGPDDSDIYKMRANSFAKIKAYQYSFVDFKRALKVDPENVEVYLSRARVYADQFIYLNAIDDYNKVIELKPDMAKAYFYRASLKRKMRDETNVKDFIKAVTKDEECARTYIKNYIKNYNSFIKDEVCAAIKEQYGEKKALGFFNMRQINK